MKLGRLEKIEELKIRRYEVMKMRGLEKNGSCLIYQAAR